MQVNVLLEASLKNAMLKRDIPGLRAIISELSDNKDIASLAILNPAGEVRFSSDPSREGMAFPDPIDVRSPSTQFVNASDGGAVVRAVKPVNNEERCQECHGPINSHPVNGILVVDYAAGQISNEALRSAALLAGAGGIVLFASLTAIALFLQRRVLFPLRHLTDATDRFAAGDLDLRLQPRGQDEVAQLGRSFVSMASDLDRSLHTLRLKEEFLQKLMDALPDGVRVIDTDYRILMVNGAYCRQLGIRAEDAIGSSCHLSSHGLDTPCSPTLVTCPLQELTRRSQVLKCQHRHVTSDGSELFVEVSAARATIERDGQTVDCVIEVIRDLSEQLKFSHQHRLSEIGQFAAGIAHEIHNPLASIHLALDAIRAEATSAAPHDRVLSYVEVANREIDRCINITNRLLRISEPPSDDIALVDITSVLRDVVALVDYQATQAQVSILIKGQKGLRILACEADMATVAINLVQNAIHAMPSGGRLTICITNRDKCIEINFSDTGVGIGQDDLQRIFWPFWSRRADGSTGSGLGLSICKAAVSRMKGAIQIRSRQGQGTTVCITLPNADELDSAA